MHQKQVYEDPEKEAVIDNIGSFPFILKAEWKDGKLRIVVEQPDAGAPWPKHEFECLLLDCKQE